jgi:retron-type reverse transcriptase
MQIEEGWTEAPAVPANRDSPDRSRPNPESVSTKLERIAKLAQQMPGTALRTLSHHIDIEWLKGAYRRTRKDGAAGVDGQSAQEYAAKLESNLKSLLERAKSGDHYRAPAAGVMEEGQLHHPDTGTPQGGVISPILAKSFCMTCSIFGSSAR